MFFEMMKQLGFQTGEHRPKTGIRRRPKPPRSPNHDEANAMAGEMVDGDDDLRTFGDVAEMLEVWPREK